MWILTSLKQLPQHNPTPIIAANLATVATMDMNHPTRTIEAAGTTDHMPKVDIRVATTGATAGIPVCAIDMNRPTADAMTVAATTGLAEIYEITLESAHRDFRPCKLSTSHNLRPAKNKTPCSRL